MKMSLLIGILLLLSISFAWVTGYGPPSCMTQYSVLGVNFTDGVTEGATAGCPTNTNYTAIYSGGADSTVWDIGYSLGSMATVKQNFSGVVSSGTYGAYNDNNTITVKAIATNATAVIKTTTSVALADLNVTYQVSNGSDAITMTILGGNNTTTKAFNVTTTTITDGTTTLNLPSGIFYASCLLASPQHTSFSITFAYTCNFSMAATMFSGADSTMATLSEQGYTAYYYISRFGGKMLRSDFGSGNVTDPNPATYSKALLYYGGLTLQPRITYIPSTNAFFSFYNTTNNVAYLPNNTVVYILDGTTLQWYVVPATTFIDTSTIYTISTLFYNSLSSTATYPLPVLPISRMCRQSGDLYLITSTYSQSVQHIVYFDNGTNFSNYLANGATLNYSVNTSLYQNVNYTVNGNSECLRDSDTSMLGFSALNIPVSTYRPILYLLWIASLGISLAVPFAAVFPILLNDLFDIISVTTMGELLVAIGIVSVLIRGSDKNTVKASLVYILFGIIIITNFYIHSGVTTPEFTSVTSNLTQSVGNLSSLAGDPTKANLGGFSAALPTFIISVFTLILQFPSILSSAMLTPLKLLSMPIYTAAAQFLTVFIYGAYVYILLVAWEKIANRFQQV
jgi:hypothetical protein